MMGDSTTHLCATPPQYEPPTGEFRRLIERMFPAPRFPEIGDFLGDFLLVAELGRGAAGRVFLATQPGVAGRPVVLKVVTRHCREFLSLGRLQHTNVIPLYSVIDFRERGLQALCQPYFGGADLGRIFRELRKVPVQERTGAAVVQACDRVASCAPSSTTARRRLTNASYVEAICWIGACLADGLHHAHQRGLVHLDLKPSNVLLTADGEPMLLDFHLAHAPIEPGQSVPETFGGTSRYMSPEQSEAFAAARCGSRAPRAVGLASDVFSLGRILYVALGGTEQETFDEPPNLRSINPNVSQGLDAIVCKCLRNDPEQRYSTAQALADDLRRHLADEPLRGVVNRSWAERWRKWRRRRPHAPLWTGLSLALVALPLYLVGVVQARLYEARASLDVGQRLVQERRYAEAGHALQRGRDVLADVPFGRDLRVQIDESLRRTERAAAADRLRAFAEQVRFLAGIDDDTRTLDDGWRRLWNQRALLLDAEHAPLDKADEDRIQVDFADVLESRSPDDEEMMTWRERTQRVRTANPWWKRLAEGRALLREAKYAAASVEFSQAAEERPGNFWAHFHQGVCLQRLGRPGDAVAEFNVACALAPESAETYCNRGLAHTAAGDNALAVRDFDRALALKSTLAQAALGRGIAHVNLGRPTEALADFRLALKLGIDPNLAQNRIAQVRLLASQ